MISLVTLLWERIARMRFKARYTGASLTPHNAAAQGLEVVRRVVSIDIGLTNYAICRLAYVRDTRTEKTRYVVENAAVIDLTNDQSTSRSIDVYGRNLWIVLNGGDMSWMWSANAPICIERQVDHIQGLRDDNNDDAEKQKKSNYKPPFMFTLYSMTMMIVLARASPVAVLDDSAWQEMEAAGIDPTGGAFINENIQWVPRSGSQKSGLEGTHGDERKVETLTKGPEIAHENNDDKYVDYMMMLAKPKPREDACDSYLQALHYLNELELLAKKEERKNNREAEKKRKSGNYRR